ncbi:GH24187 [Drosophila grimshawi]|uniref:GH24187 n=1 Tax=Drosophila grimshawi TaxID=7222 RepID=B4JN85_DROGR|nr:GH24187 [Drosophila grimshawi]
MAAISGKVDAETSWTEAESALQQLKATKNKSNLFLIKSYSCIEKTSRSRNKSNNNNNNNNSNINNNNNKINNKNKNNNENPTKLLSSPDMEPFPDISSLILADESTKKQKARFKLQLKKLPKTKSKRVKAEKEQQEQEQQLDKDRELELSEQEVQLLRCNAHEYEELLEHLPHASHASLPRPQSLPGKVQFDAAAVGATLDQPHPLPTIRHGGNTQHIKRESFLRQSLQSIRRSFGSHKHSSKLSIASGVDAGGTLRPTLPSPAGSSNASSSSSSSSTSTTSSTTSSCSSSTAINLLSRAQAHNHILDEFLPTPVVLLLNDDPAHHSDVSDAVYVAKR